MTTDNIGLPILLTGLEATEKQIIEFGIENPEKAYILGNQLAKVGKKVQEQFKDGFRSYYDNNKELPGSFICQVKNGSKKYNYYENEQWDELKNQMDNLEKIIESATDMAEQGKMIFDENGEQIHPVNVIFTASSYTITKKK